MAPPPHACGAGTIATILWLEDNGKDRRLIREALRELRASATVEFADDGQAFLDRLPELRPDLAVLDLRMPGLDGMDILEFLHGHPLVGNLPIVLFSSSGVAHDVATGERYRLHVRESLHKPATFEEFKAAVARIAAHAEHRPAS